MNDDLSWLATLLRSHRDRYVDFTEEMVERFRREALAAAPAQGPQIEPAEAARLFAQYDRATIEQMVDGSLAVMLEALDGRQRQTYDMFLATIVPAMIESGVPARGLIESQMSWAVCIASDVALHAPPELRAAGLGWLSGYFSRYGGDLATAAYATRP